MFEVEQSDCVLETNNGCCLDIKPVKCHAPATLLTGDGAVLQESNTQLENTPTTTRFRQRLCKSRIMGQKKSGVKRWEIFSAIENIVLKIMSYHMALAITMDTPHMSLLMIWHNIILKNAYILRHSLRPLNIQY